MDAGRIAAVPVCVDLDGTLSRTDTLMELALAFVKIQPWNFWKLFVWVLRSRATLKSELARSVPLEPSSLVYNDDLLAWLGEQARAGRKLILTTGANEAVAQAVAAHLGIFDEVLASNAQVNLTGPRKRDLLVARFGARGFDYVANDRADLPVWSQSRGAVLVGAGPAVAQEAAGRTEVLHRIDAPAGSGALRTWIRALRVHQWAKNALLFVPLLMGHRIGDPVLLQRTVLALVSFSLCASNVYVLNDLLDLGSDRRHPRKRLRPFAAGTLSLSHGLVVAVLLLLASVAVALLIGLPFIAALGVYYATTLAYSFRLKKEPLVDVLALAALYTIRIIAGSAATGIAISPWLLAFSIFMFLSLGIVKRVTELEMVKASGKSGAPAGRGYHVDDLPLLRSFGVSAGYTSIVVIALYLNSADSRALYAHPKLLWGLCPLLLYWINRVWFITHRGGMHDDPILFAIKDRVSIAVGVCCLLVLLAASW